jgi:hypothetical protein
MADLDRLIALRAVGLRSEGIGPDDEWAPVPDFTFQQRHAGFWGQVSDLIENEPGDYDDLPRWMTEDAAEQLEHNR